MMPAVPPVILAPSGWGRNWIWIGIAAALVAAVVLFFFNPSQHGFYPRCFFKMVTGLDCPGCGGLRATHQLLHGHMRAALELNPLFVVSLPLLAYFAARSVIQYFTGRAWPQPFRKPAWLWAAGAVVLAFGVLRNLPWRAWFGA